MPSDTAKRKPFTIFRAADEAEIRMAEHEWDNEGGHMSASAVRIFHIAGAELPYNVVLTRWQGQTLHRSFETMRDAEAFIRRNTPTPAPALSTLYDRPAPKS